MNKSLTVSLSNPSTTSSGGGKWVSVEQEEYDEPIATQGELASFIDSLYNIDPCKAEQVADPNANDGFYVDESKPDVWGAPPEEDFNFLVKEQLPPEMCDFTEDSGYTATLNVFMSDVREQFKLVLDVGIVGLERRVKEPFEDRIVIENATRYTLKYPVAGDFEYNWISLVRLGGGVVNVKVDSEDKRTLSFGTAVTGTLEVSYETEYYKVGVFIPGENGEPQSSNATVFYVGLVAETDIEPPDVDEGDAVSKDAWCVPNPLDQYENDITKVPFPNHDVTCQVEVTVRHLCNCSKTLSYTSTYLENTSCPDRTRCYNYQTECTKIIGYRTDTQYVDCGETTEDINDPEFYEQNCCEPVPEDMALPTCKRTYSDKGTLPLDEDIANEYIRQYGEVVSFVGVGPKDGVCGEHIVEQVLVARQCCENVEPMYFSQSVDEVEWYKSYVFCVEGGLPPYNWTTEGAGLSVSGSGSCVTVEVSNYFCGPGTVKVSDYCDQVIAHEVTSEAEELAYDDVSSDTVISDNSSGTVYVDGGNPPFTISLSGQNFFTDSSHTEYQKTQEGRAFAIYTADACGLCSITITDKCGQSVSGSVSSTSGEWAGRGYNDIPSWFREVVDPDNDVDYNATLRLWGELGGWRVGQYWSGRNFQLVANGPPQYTSPTYPCYSDLGLGNYGYVPIVEGNVIWDAMLCISPGTFAASDQTVFVRPRGDDPEVSNGKYIQGVHGYNTGLGDLYEYLRIRVHMVTVYESQNVLVYEWEC